MCSVTQLRVCVCARVSSSTDTHAHTHAYYMMASNDFTIIPCSTTQEVQRIVKGIMNSLPLKP